MAMATATATKLRLLELGSIFSSLQRALRGGALGGFHVARGVSSRGAAVEVPEEGDDGDESGNGIRAWLHKLPPVSIKDMPPDGGLITATKWVSRCLPDCPRTAIQKLFRRRAVRMEVEEDDASTRSTTIKLRRVTARRAVKEGVVLLVPESIVKPGKKKPIYKGSSEPTEEDVKLLKSTLLYKDDDVIVINKPVGLPVQGGSNVDKSLCSMKAAAFQEDYDEPPRLVHRLDKDVSGALVLARTYQSSVLLHDLMTKAQRCMPGEIRGKEMDRRYTALVIGVPGAKEGLIVAPLIRMVIDGGKSDRIMIADDPNSEGAMEAITEYKVLRSSVLGCTWLQLRPITGRKHQLRVHCAQGLGLPIVGDEKYGWRTHKKWLEERCMYRIDPQDLKARHKMRGSVVSKKPMLHLHSRAIILPKLRGKTDEAKDDPKEREVLAPLPVHMELSWKVKDYQRPKKKVDV